MTLWLIRFILFTLQMEDNHLWKLRDNSYDKEKYYDEWYDQTEEENLVVKIDINKSEFEKILRFNYLAF